MYNTHYIWKNEAGFPVATISLNLTFSDVRYGVLETIEGAVEYCEALSTQPNVTQAIKRSRTGFLFWETTERWHAYPKDDDIIQPFVNLLGFNPVKLTVRRIEKWTMVMVTHSHKVAAGNRGWICGYTGKEVLPNQLEINTFEVEIDGGSVYYLRADEFQLLN